jgi:hypothetical protein
MAIQTITYSDKQAMGTQPSIPEINKITDSNINEIKTVVNNNASLLNVSMTYSTTEQVVGTWIDNKPIYRKVYSISGTMAQNAWTTLVSISNVDTLTKGLMGGSSNNCVWNDAVLRVVSDNLQYYCPLTHAYTWAIIEYTKTTD